MRLRMPFLRVSLVGFKGNLSLLDFVSCFFWGGTSATAGFSWSPVLGVFKREAKRKATVCWHPLIELTCLVALRASLVLVVCCLRIVDKCGYCFVNFTVPSNYKELTRDIVPSREDCVPGPPSQDSC